MVSQWLHNVSELLDLLEQGIGKPGDLTSTLQHIAKTAQMFFAADVCVIFTINPITGRFIRSLTVSDNLLTSDREVYEQSKPERVTQQVLRQGVLVVEDLEIAPQYQSKFTHSEGIRSFVALALGRRKGQQPLGTLYLDFKEQQKFNPEDYELFQLFADQASFILQETWLLRRYQQVARIGQEINQDLDTVDDLFQKLQKNMAGIVDTSHTVMLSVYQPQTNTLDIYMKEEGRSIFLKNIPPEGASQYVIETQETMFIQQMSKEAEQLPFHRITITGTRKQESLIFVPLVLRGVTLGVLSIQHSQPNAYNQGDQFILELLATHIALALHNIRLYSSLSRLNEAGQLLTQQLESEQTLQATVEKIRDATQADIVVLYPFEPARQRFVLPPRRSGTLLDSPIQSLSPSQPDDIAVNMLHLGEPIFARESTILYNKLLGEGQSRQGNFAQREKVRSTAAVPLQVGKESVGVLFVNFRQPQRFDKTQKLFIEGLAHFAAIAIRNTQEFGTLIKRRLRELEILQNIDRELSRTLDLDSLLNTILKLAYERVHADEASILLRNSRLEALVIPAAIGDNAEARLTHVIPTQATRGITRWVLEHKKPARVANVHTDQQWRDLYIEAAAGTVSELDIPLLDGEEVVGVLNFESTREGAFSQEDEDFLLTLAGQAVLAIKNAQAYEREKRLAEEGQILNEISKEITSQFDHIHVFNLILKKTLELTRSTLGALLLYDPEMNDLWIASKRGLGKVKENTRIALSRGIVGYVATHKRLLNVDVSQSPWNEIYLELFSGTLSELAVPMLAGNELRGVLNVESTSPNQFDEGDERLLKGLADLAVVALQNAERYEKARWDAQRFELLYQAGQELSKITDLGQLEQAYDVILRIAEQHGQCHVVIRRFDEDAQELELIRASQPDYPALFQRSKLNVGANGQVARERRTIVIDDINNPPSDIVPLKLSDPTTRSMVIMPIMFKDRYYGNFGLRHENIGYFRGTDIHFFEGLSQQLASTIYRLETLQARQESEQRAKAAEAMSEIGQMAFELTHRWDNDLGLVRSYVNDIRSELKELGVTNTFIAKKLENIVQATRTVLDLGKDLKQEFVRSGEAAPGEPILLQSRIGVSEPENTHPKVLLEEAQNSILVLSTIKLHKMIDEDVAMVRVIHSLVTDILRNLVSNAVEAMPDGGLITLSARNAGNFVALEVADTGIGISQSSVAKIFDLFYSTKGSSGFGLWSARRNALRNHGDLRVKSIVGHGTTFTLLLPRVGGETT